MIFLKVSFYIPISQRFFVCEYVIVIARYRVQYSTLYHVLRVITILKRKIFFSHNNNKQVEEFLFHSKKVLNQFDVILTTKRIDSNTKLKKDNYKDLVNFILS